jgi:hypothetical protein
MRSFHLLELQKDIAKEEQNLEFWVDNFGGSAAAWLIWEHRHHFRRDGYFDFYIPADKKTPPWFRVAIATLRQRQHWRVNVFTAGGKRTYCVRWLGHGTQCRAS